MKQDYVINRIRLKELREALSLVSKVFLEYEAPDYCDEGIAEFMKFIEYAAIRQKLGKREFLMWTCKADEEIVGVLATRPPCHISLLFVAGEHQRRGIARCLLATVRDYYKTHYNYKEITVNSSPYAIAVYHRLGFKDISGEQTVNGIRFVPMRRSL